MVSTITANDRYAQHRMDELLAAAGIRRDRNLDYSCGVFDDAGELIATGSCFKNTLRCLAVVPARQGEGLLGALVTHLLQVQLERGNTHVFLYTKPQSAAYFEDLGFFEIARTADVVFLENRRNGFSAYLDCLERGGGDAAAVVMNADPFTLGHRWLVEQATKAHGTVHVFVLSEEAGPIPFSVRKRLVAEGLRDVPNVVLHDSGPYIISAATFPSYFLPDGEAVVRAQAALDLAVFCRIAAALSVTERFVGEEPGSATTRLYNETMLRTLPERGIRCRILPRLAQNGVPISASTVRDCLRRGTLDAACAMLPPPGAAFFRSAEAAPILEAIRAL